MMCGCLFLVTVKWSCSVAARSAISVNLFFASVIDGGSTLRFGKRIFS
jgi:hypothetical protein